MAEGVLTVGELIVLRATCCKHLPGERFELLPCIRADWHKDSESWADYASMLCGKGYLERGGDGLYSVTELGVETWKAIVPTWEKAYRGMGVLRGRKGKR